MSLLHLPPEILVQIFEHVGSLYFHEDPGRLVVCKQWYMYAHTAHYRELYFDSNSLRHWMSSHSARKRSQLVKGILEVLNLELTGFKDCKFTPMARSRSGLSTQSEERELNLAWIRDSDEDLVQFAKVARGRSGLSTENEELELKGAWIGNLNEDMTQLARVARKSGKLRVLRIKADARDSYLLFLFPGMRALLSVGNLTALELDLLGTYRKSQRNYPLDVHVCRIISAFLSTLRCLRLRLPYICADVLRLQHHETNLRLSEVLINLSLEENCTRTRKRKHSTPCSDPHSLIESPRASIEEQAAALVHNMASPKIFRVLDRVYPEFDELKVYFGRFGYFETQSFDVLTGKRMRLGDCSGWEDDGEIIPACSEAEFETPNDIFSTTSDELSPYDGMVESEIGSEEASG